MPSDATVFICKNTRKFLALASANLFNNPSKKLFTVAITGTKGKTTTSYFLKNILDEYTNSKNAIISSIEIFDGFFSNFSKSSVVSKIRIFLVFSPAFNSKLSNLFILKSLFST
ncbi:MAG: hypothetical protein RRY76_02990, partial [Clostridia bacterium]